VSFHLGSDNVTIDLAGVETLTEDNLRHVSNTANRLLYEDRAVRPSWVSREEAEAMLARGDLRKLPEREGPIRLVEIAGVEFNACGGTHVASTGAIGSISLRKVQKAKQGLRVEFACGLRAVRAAREDYLRLGELGAVLSAGSADLVSRVTGLIEDKKAMAKELKTLKREIAEKSA
jgi:alanyl-tRNA synthetase